MVRPKLVPFTGEMKPTSFESRARPVESAARVRLRRGTLLVTATPGAGVLATIHERQKLTASEPF